MLSFFGYIKNCRRSELVFVGSFGAVLCVLFLLNFGGVLKLNVNLENIAAAHDGKSYGIADLMLLDFLNQRGGISHLDIIDIVDHVALLQTRLLALSPVTPMI